jgi:lactocepin
LTIKLRTVKPVIASFLALLLVLSGLFPAAAMGQDRFADGEEAPDFHEQLEEKQASLQEQDNTYEASEEVRVLVELVETSPVEFATQQGISYADLPESERQSLQSDSINQQTQIKNTIDNMGIEINYLEEFSSVINGFSAEVNYEDAKKIETIRGVQSVQVVNEYERPDEGVEMTSSNDITKAIHTHENYGYKGEGMVVGVIDTGVDPDHQDFVLPEGTDARHIESAVADHAGPGKWYTEKVPYGYNYMDNNHDILDLTPGASSHGMHVAGSVGANGDVENGGIKGVAPEAQILALKVFGNDPAIPTTYGDIYVKAIDDALALGVDVLNLSLGSTAGFVNEDNPEQQAVARAKDNGVVVTISAGNSDAYGSGFVDTHPLFGVALPKLPYSANPDIGVTGAPSVSDASFSVASSDNTMVQMSAVNYQVGDETGSLAYTSHSNYDPVNVLDGEVEVVFAGLGGAEDFEEVDVEGKVALIIRGAYPFVEKSLNAQENGAVASIIYNNTTGTINMASDPAINIPHLFMLNDDGVKLNELSQQEDGVTVSFSGESTTVPNPTAGQMSAFTSWGLTSNLDFKPEITAPGGDIFSTLQNGEYGVMSGTSMAAPTVAGGSALILEHVDAEWDLSGAERSLMAKNLLMNTSVPKADLGYSNVANELGSYYSPRRQGSGEMDIHAAASTPVLVTGEDGEGKVALREFEDETSFDLTVTNLSEEDITYDLGLVLQTDMVYGDPSYGYQLGGFNFELESSPIQGADYSFSYNGQEVSNVSLKGEEEVTISINMDLDGATSYDAETGEFLSVEDLFENGYFVEGFVTLEDTNDEYPMLSVPYAGFNGDFGNLPVIDGPIYGDPADSYYSYTSLLDDDFTFLGQDQELGFEGAEDRYAFSPELSSVTPIISFLRNAKKVEFNVLDEDGKHLRTIRSVENERKNFFDGGIANPYTIFANAAWDGTIKGKVVEDGMYHYEVRSQPDFVGAKWQSFVFPIQVDTIAPEVKAQFNSKDNELTWAASDEGVGISHFTVLKDGKVQADDILREKGSYTFEKVVSEGTNLTVRAHDYAGNISEARVSSDDGNRPFIYLNAPDLLVTFNDSTVKFTGYIENTTNLDSFKIDGKEVPTKWNTNENRYEFSYERELEDGVYDFSYVAIDDQGRDYSFSRKFRVDTTPGEISFDAPSEVANEEDSLALDVTLTDNFDQLRLLVDDSEVYSQAVSSNTVMVPGSHELTLDFDLEVGENTFVIELHDIGGNVTEEVLTVNRLKEGENLFKGFTDIDDNWAKDYINELAAKDIIGGFPDGTFRPGIEIERGQFVALLVRSLGLERQSDESPFSDTHGVLEGEIVAAYDAGLTVGRADGTFGQDEVLNREQMAILIVRALDFATDMDIPTDAELTYGDLRDISPTALPYVAAAGELGLMQGTGSGNFKPHATALRDQAAVVLHRFHKMIIE